MTYRIRTRYHKNSTLTPQIKTELSRHSIAKQNKNKVTEYSQNDRSINFNLQALPISRKLNIQSNINYQNIIQARSNIKKDNRARFTRIYYRYRNGRRGKDIKTVRMNLVKLAIRYYQIKTHGAELTYDPDTNKKHNAAANYRLKDDKTIDSTIIKFYPQLFTLPLNSFINTIRHEAYHVFLYHKGIYDVDIERRCHKPIHEFLAEAKEILSKNKENPRQFYQDANRALRNWILIYDNPPIPDFQDIDEAKLLEFMEQQYDKVERELQKRYTDFIEEYGKDNKLAKKLQSLIRKYNKHRP